MEYTTDFLRSAASLFSAGEPEELTLLSSSERENDFRCAVLLVTGGEKSVLKLASNAFTSHRRIEGWELLIRETRALGYRSPALLHSVNGRLSEEIAYGGRRFVVWREEFAPYSLAQTEEELEKDEYRQKDAARPRSTDGTMPAWQEELILFYASLGAKRLTGFPGPSGYARLVPFDGDATDEVEECADLVGECVREKHPALVPRWEGIRSRWAENRAALARIRPRLPTSAFQADWNDTNVLLTEDGHFAGLIDYNIAGEDTVLNMALSIGSVGFNASAGGKEAEKARAETVLALFSRKYPWNEDEIEAAPLLWRYIQALYWSEVHDMRKAKDDGEAAAVLDRIEAGLSEEVSFAPFMRRTPSA